MAGFYLDQVSVVGDSSRGSKVPMTGIAGWQPARLGRSIIGQLFEGPHLLTKTLPWREPALAVGLSCSSILF